MTESENVRALISKIGVSQREAARLVGVNERSMRKYCSERNTKEIPKAILISLECLANHGVKE